MVWTPEEELALLVRQAVGMSPAGIAVHPDHRRSERAIVRRLARLEASEGQDESALPGGSSGYG